MSAKKILVIAAVAGVAVIYYHLYGDYFSKGSIQIRVTHRPQRISRARPQPGVPPPDDELIFATGPRYRFTDIQVVDLAALQTNKHPHPLWHMVTESNSVPVDTFVYGRGVRGMHAFINGAPPDPLMPSTGYRILVEAGSIKGHHDFHTPPAPAPPQ